MSIIILAQSLKNDGTGTADIQIDGEFAPPPEKQHPLAAFYKNGGAAKHKKCGGSGLQFGKVPGLLPINSILCFMVDGEEKDDMGRNSPIAIQAKLTEIQYVIKHLENFLQKSGRTISQEKMKAIKGKINFERKKACIRIRRFLSQIQIIGGLK